MYSTKPSRYHPSWEWGNANYEAYFKENGKPTSCVLDKSGTLLETETEIVQSGIPAAINTYFSDHYKRKKTKEIASICKANREVNYEVAVAEKELIFDQLGKLKKVKTDLTGITTLKLHKSGIG